MGGDSVLADEGLEVLSVGFGSVGLLGCEVVFEAEEGEQGSGFADVPFDWVEAVAAVCDVSRADVFASRKEVLGLGGDQGAERKSEGEGRGVDGRSSVGGGVKVNAVRADADGVFERRGEGEAGVGVGGDVLLFDSGEGFYATGFAEVWRHGEAIFGAGEVGAKAESFVAVFGLKPVEVGEGELAGAFEVAGGFGGGDVDDMAEGVVVHWPVHDGGGFVLVEVVGGVDDLTVGKEVEPVVAEQGEMSRFSSLDIKHSEA